MTTKTCGCSSETCGCCEGIQKLTPAAIENRPALPALQYRVGTHGTFFSTMKARLSTMRVNGPGADGQTLEAFWPLTGLTTRDESDPAIAFLDGWATVADVLTFYQERIANEGYLRTATERRSVLELARLLGYNLRPGVASTVYLAYTLDDKQLEPVQIPLGARTQSVPGPGELPQTFETSEKIVARSQWNNLQVRLTRPLDITLGNVLSLQTLCITGLTSNLKAGDTLLFVFGSSSTAKAARMVAEAELQTDADRTLLRLAPPPVGTVEALPVLNGLIQLLSKQGPDAAGVLLALKELRMNTFLGLAKSPLDWPETLLAAYDPDLHLDIKPIAEAFAADLQKAVEQAKTVAPVETTSPDKFVSNLLEEPRVQPANSLSLRRRPERELGPSSDAYPQLLVSFAPKLRDSYYAAWSNANVNSAQPALQALFVLRLKASIFGANAPKVTSYSTAGAGTGNGGGGGIPQVTSQVTEHALASDERQDSVFLEQAFETVVPDSFAIIQSRSLFREGFKRLAVPVTSVVTGQRAEYGINGKSTWLKFAEAWRPELATSTSRPDLGAYRETLVYTQSEPLTLVPSPMADDVSGAAIELAELYDGLVSGRWIIIFGERADIPNVAGIFASELVMISGLRQDFRTKGEAETTPPGGNAPVTVPDGTIYPSGTERTALPGDKTHTTLLLAKSIAYRYKRGTVKIFGNVVKATHGETRNETLGSGDGSQALQAFTLKQPPLTFLPAPTPEGAESTLKVYVNDIQWHEIDTLAGLSPKDRKFVTKTDDDAATTVIFGNGKEGSRLPTGLENVRAIYRNGIGKTGNVKAEQISLLQTKPLGVKSVINPLRASGGADKETRDQARENAPLMVAALDRLVGVQDYTDFTRTFAGIAKAHARRLSDGRRQLVHVTIAGADDVPIGRDSDLYRNLLAALRKYGDEALPVQIDSRELVVLVLSAKLQIAPDYLWEKVAEKVRTAVGDAFSFQHRALGQPALLCEVIGVIQNVEGVTYVDVDAFGGLPEKTVETDAHATPTGKRRLVTQTELTNMVRVILNPSTFNSKVPPGPAERVEVNLADFENGTLRPAQLAIFTPAVPDTLIINQIL